MASRRRSSACNNSQECCTSSVNSPLIDVARARGIETMYSMDSAEITHMHDLAKALGFHTRPDPDDATQVIHQLALQD